MTLNEIKISYKRSNIRTKSISGTLDAYEILRDIWEEHLEPIDYIETMVVLLLDRSNKPLSFRKISQGGQHSTTVDLKTLFSVVLLSGSTSIIIAHNHPSGSLRPSSNDIDLTNKVKEACNILDVSLLDHLIMTSSGYTSFVEESLL